jgi:hypothetical protein
VALLSGQKSPTNFSRGCVPHLHLQASASSARALSDSGLSVLMPFLSYSTMRKEGAKQPCETIIFWEVGAKHHVSRNEDKLRPYE